mmetsp:Transcript_2686/g.3881  ORF Transcript_2686/g.3881 Transcript_2686/m.3881 type:complete len:907 (+) Transcript_2686:38-2758(+)
MGGAQSEVTRLTEVKRNNYGGIPITGIPLAESENGKWAAKDVIRASVAFLSCLLSFPLLGYPALVAILRTDHVFQHDCTVDDCKTQAAFLSTTIVLALWTALASPPFWTYMERHLCGSSGVALAASVLSTVGWGFLVACHQDFIFMGGFMIAAFAGSGIMTSMQSVHTSFLMEQRPYVRLIVMTGVEGSPIVLAIVRSIFIKHAITMKTIFTALGIICFITGCMLYVLVLAEQVPSLQQTCISSPLDSPYQPRGTRQQEPYSGNAALVHSLPPPLGGDIVDSKYPNGCISVTSEFKECGLFSSILPYTLRNPSYRRSWCVSSAPDRQVLMPTGIWESFGGIETAQSSALFVMLTIWLGMTMGTVWHYVASLGMYLESIHAPREWTFKQDMLPIIYAWALPATGILIPLLSFHVVDSVPPSAFFIATGIFGILYGILVYLQGNVTAVFAMTFVMSLRVATSVLPSLVLEQVYGSYRLEGLQKTLNFRAAFIAATFVLAMIWLPSYMEGMQELNDPTNGKADMNSAYLNIFWWLSNSKPIENNKSAEASLFFGLSSGVLSFIIARMLQREERPQLKKQLSKIFNHIRVDLDGFVEWEEYWHISQYFEIEAKRIPDSWREAVSEQRNLDSGVDPVVSPRSFAGNAGIPLPDRSKSNGSFTAFINAKNAPGWPMTRAMRTSSSPRRKTIASTSGGTGLVGRNSTPAAQVTVTNPASTLATTQQQRRESKIYEVNDNGTTGPFTQGVETGGGTRVAQAAELGIRVLGRINSNQITEGGDSDIERVRPEVVLRQMWREFSKSRCPDCCFYSMERTFETVKLSVAISGLHRRQLHGESNWFLNEIGHPEPLSNSFSPASEGNGVFQRSMTHWIEDGDEDWEGQEGVMASHVINRSESGIGIRMDGKIHEHQKS